MTSPLLQESYQPTKNFSWRLRSSSSSYQKTTAAMLANQDPDLPYLPVPVKFLVNFRPSWPALQIRDGPEREHGIRLRIIILLLTPISTGMVCIYISYRFIDSNSNVSLANLPLFLSSPESQPLARVDTSVTLLKTAWLNIVDNSGHNLST